MPSSVTRSRSEIIDRLAPKLDVPRCPNGNHHYPHLYKGSPSQAEMIGRHSYYVRDSDDALCDITRFPVTSCSIYDSYKEDFIPVSTFSSQCIEDHNYLILRFTSFTDDECPGVHELIRGIRAVEYSGSICGSTNVSNKRRFEDESGVGPLKRKKGLDTKIIDLTIDY
jgi:hypothetical protein